MEKPNKKLKKFLIILGIAGMVYAGFQYLLPLVIPFLAALFLAALLLPSVRALQKKCRISINGRTFYAPASVIGAAELFLMFLLLAAGIYLGGRRLWQEAMLFMDNLPEMIQVLDRHLTGWCQKSEELLGFSEGMIVKQVQDMLRSLARSVKSGAVPYMMVNSMAALKMAFSGAFILFVIFLAAVMFIQEMEAFQNYMKKSLFREEYALLRRLLMETGRAYGRTQLIIMTVTAGICMAGLFLLGNPYYGLLGILIGILDALPLLGTGTIFIPWAAVSLVFGKTRYGISLLAIYFICYMVREVLEARLMGGKVGLSPLQTLAAIYIGIRLFGLFGFFLGPIAFLIIRDAVRIYQ